MSKIILVNITRETIMGPVEFAETFFSRLRGLMFKKKINSGLVLKIPAGRGKRGSAIHMFFMRIPLDILFINENKQVVDMVSLDPWTTYTPRESARYVIELKKGIIKTSSTKIGDIIDFK